ncbi:MAG: hypothetical protein IPJ65_15580 [Archangiaceae bacterium]|nr:hypothetical protein [Archangiaceae bacterium]
MQINRFARLASLLAGGSLMVFIATEVVLLRPHHPLPLLLFAVGAGIAAPALPRRT